MPYVPEGATGITKKKKYYVNMTGFIDLDL
jgi:hypothetical protein